MTIWPKTLFKAKILTQKFITSYKIDPKFIFQPKRYPKKMAHPVSVSQSMGVIPPILQYIMKQASVLLIFTPLTVSN